LQTEVFSIKQHHIFQIIENEAAHFAETEAGAVMICMTSLAAVLDGEQTLTPAANGRR
jgi:hypothetical protein